VGGYRGGLPWGCEVRTRVEHNMVVDGQPSASIGERRPAKGITFRFPEGK
jgi:hypothetical protein